MKYKPDFEYNLTISKHSSMCYIDLQKISLVSLVHFPDNHLPLKRSYLHEHMLSSLDSKTNNRYEIISL